MGDVVPLRTQPTTDSRVPKAPKYKPDSVPVPTARKILSSIDNSIHIDTDEDSSHRKNGVQKRMMQKLKRGHYPVKDQLDMHHMTTNTAHTALLEFIAAAQSGTLECVRIIHGKGLRSQNGPRLKLMTRQLLRDHPQVLAFTVCKPPDGGAGAVDVLLKST